jgi:DNA repair protein RadA/Sms
MVVAVLQRRASIAIGRQDIYAATIGGVRLTEPSVDLAVALALASAGSDASVPADLVAIGEVGLAGEIRRVGGVQRRLAEAQRLGFRRAIVPPGSGFGRSGAEARRRPGGDGPAPPDVREAPDIRTAIALALGG